MGIKEKLGKKTQTSKQDGISKLLIKANLFVFHYDAKQKMIHPGIEDPNKIYYVIRPRGITEGLLSIWFTVLDNITWAFENGYIPYVDFSEENRDYCQYYVDREIEGTKNAWEYYFEQPSDFTKEEIYAKKNVLLSGWSFTPNKVVKKPEGAYKYINLIKERPYVRQMVDDIEKKLFLDKKILGVFIRGTDYVSLKPKNHPVQPSVEEMILKVKEVDKMYCVDKIYLVTEDSSYYERFKAEFGNKIISIFDNNIVYKEGELLQKVYLDDPYERGLKYLVRVLLLNRCNYLISSVASGSQFAKAIRQNNPEYEYWFELGNY